jgi:cystathionine beta-lyase
MVYCKAKNQYHRKEIPRKKYDFDRVIDRRDTDSIKWSVNEKMFGSHEVISAWVADMDFKAPAAVIQALQERLQHGIFGYELPSAELKNVLCERLDHLYNWPVAPDEIIFLPGVVTGFNQACRAFVQPGESVLAQPPVYPPISKAPMNQGMRLETSELICRKKDHFLFYEIDFETFESNSSCIPQQILLQAICQKDTLESNQQQLGQQYTLIEILVLHLHLFLQKIVATDIQEFEN